MNGKIALSIATTVLTIATGTTPENADEYRFHSSEQIKTMSQEAANDYCRLKFDGIRASGDKKQDFEVMKSLFVKHVRAHVKDGECIASMSELIT